MEHMKNPLGAFLVNGFGDRYLHAVNRNAFNVIGSDALYNSIYGDTLFVEYQFNIIIGTDSGIFPKFIAKNGMAAGSRYLFIELPEVLDLLLQDGQLQDLPPEICVTTLSVWQEQATKYQFSEYVFLDAVRSLASLSCTDANLFEYRNLSWSLNLELKMTMHNISTTSNTTHFILRQIENLAENRINFSQSMLGAFAGMTGIILAGGPSLQAALPWVRENRDRVVIIAVSRISRILLSEGIVPHLIVTVDPQKISFEVSREVLSMVNAHQAPLFVASYHASPLLVGQWPGKSVFGGPLFPWQTPLNSDKLGYYGPTVGNYALSIAMHLGLETIVLAGVDLCFTPEGQTHAAGSNENKVGPNLGQVSARIETYGGLHADTNQGYAEALHVLGVQARLAAQRRHRLYNCSESAAKVPLIDFISLEEITFPDTETTPAAIIAAHVPEPTAQALRTHYRLVKKELLRARRKFQQILSLSREALDCADGLFGANGRKRDFRHKTRMDRIERRLDGSFGDFSVLVKKFGIRKFLAILKTPKQAEDWTDEQIEKATRDYYEAYVVGTEYLIGLMDGALERIDSRIEEEKKLPDFDMMFSQWEKDGQFGRLPLWRKNHAQPAASMSLEQQEKVQWLEREFNRVMTEERTSQVELLEKLHDVKHIRSKALLLFSRKEPAELETMVRGLSDHPNQEKALPYLHFVSGLVAELHGETEQALRCYQHLIDETHCLTEDALQQIAALALAGNDADSALLALQCLTELSAAYLPPYADLLKAAGRFEDAFNSYNRYLGLVPEDASAMLRLGLLCVEAGILDAARELFQRVLERDSRNSAALTLLAGLESLAPIPRPAS